MRVEVFVVSWCLVISVVASNYKRREQQILASSTTQLMSSKGDTLYLETILISIDEKLRSIDIINYPRKLAKLDINLEQMGRRLENIETRLSRMETKFDLRMGKVEEVVEGKDVKDEFSAGQMVRLMENLNDKFSNKIAYLDNKIESQISRIAKKVDSVERQVQVSEEDLTERLIRNEEKLSQGESRVCLKLDEIASRSSESENVVRAVIREEVRKNVVTKIIKWMDDNLLNASSYFLPDFVNMRAETVALKNRSLQIIDMLENVSEKFVTLNESYRSQARSMEQQGVVNVDNETKDKIENMTTTLQRALRLSESKFRELDEDVESYSRKVINGIKESSDRLKGLMLNVSQEGNTTRQVIRHGLDELHKQIKPLSTMKPELAGVGQNLDRRLYELGEIVEDKFSILLTAQNAFMDSCSRIQDEERQVYEALNLVLSEVRNRSKTDMEKITKNLQNHSQLLTTNVDAIMMAILTSSNETAHRIVDLILKNRAQLVPVSNCDCSESNDIDKFRYLRSKSLTNVSGESKTSSSQRQKFKTPTSPQQTISKDFESEIDDTPMSDNEEFDEIDFKPSHNNSAVLSNLDYDQDYQADYVDS